jgi:hypothetical protein
MAVLNWDTIAMLYPIPAMVEMHRDRVIDAMKEALTALGSDALTFGFSEKMIIRFGF